VSYQTHDLTEWAQFLSLGTGLTATGWLLWLLLFEPLLDCDLDPRPLVRRMARTVHEGAVYAGNNLNRAYASAHHQLTPVAAWVWHALFTAREACRDAAALLILLTTRPEATR
jgi:hypothetical protein